MNNEIEDLKKRMDKMELIIRDSVDMAKSYMEQVCQKTNYTPILWRLDKFQEMFERLTDEKNES